MRTPQVAAAEVFRRMIIALGAGGASEEGLAAAAEIAALMGLEIEGLFIEDEAVLGLSALPFLREIEAGSLASRPFEPARLESEMRLAAGARHRALAAAARRSRTTFRFQAVRGEIEAIVSRTVGATDIMVVIEPRGAAERTSHAAVTMRRAAMRSHASVLYVPAPVRRRRGAVAAFVGRDGDQTELLRLAARIAAASDNDLVVLSTDLADAGRQRIAKLAGAAGLAAGRVRLLPLADDSPGALARALESIEQRLVVLSRGALGLDDERALTALAARLRVPILTVERPEKSAEG
ncbi:MAG: hypothetical protein Q8P46_02065 [Hyphomicrobiales bacterium]|nr:hypothetical protein [Hyphomicrobiales bacterium]